MTNKVTQIIIKTITLSLIFIMINIPISKAAQESWKDIFSAGDDFVQEGKDLVKENEVIDNGEIKKETSNIYNILLALGIVMSVIIGAILGIQIMWVSIEQQVKAKEMLLPYATGCSIIFGAFGIWKLCVTIFAQL